MRNQELISDATLEEIQFNLCNAHGLAKALLNEYNAQIGRGTITPNGYYSNSVDALGTHIIADIEKVLDILGELI